MIHSFASFYDKLLVVASSKAHAPQQLTVWRMPSNHVLLPPLVRESDPTEASPAAGAPVKRMTLDVKAKTLGYQLPHAEAEIQRIEELQRARRDEFMRRRQQRPLERATGVAHWLLSRHGDAPLEDLALAASPVAVRSVLLPQPGAEPAKDPTPPLDPNAPGGGSSMSAMERLLGGDASLSVVPESELAGLADVQRDGIGISRYQVRGDLLNWIRQVEATNERLIADAGDFSVQEETALHNALDHHISKAVTKHAARDDLVMKQSVQSLCEMMENMTRRPFAVPDDAPLRQQLEAFETQVQELYAKAIKSGGLIFGNQVTSSESTASAGGKKVESEGEIRKRQLAVGVAAAAQSQHLMLSQVQLDQVLNALYQQRQPGNKREKGRLERQLVQSMIREDNLTSSLRRRNVQLTDEVERLQEGMQQLLEERQRLKALTTPSLIPVPTSQGGSLKGDDIQTTNETIQTMAEILAKKSIREMQIRLDALESESKEAKHELEILKVSHASVVEERDVLQARLTELEAERARQEEQKRLQEEERKRLFGGMKSDQQYYLSTIHRVLLHSAAAIGGLTLCIGDAADKAGGPEQQRDCTSAWEGALKSVDQWIGQCSFAFHFSEASKCAVNEVRANVSERVRLAAARLSSRGVVAVPVAETPAELNRQLVSELAQRLDAALGEAKSKFRELRYMRSLLWYLIHCFEAMLNGTYSDEVHGKRTFRNPGATEKSAVEKGKRVLERARAAGSYKADDHDHPDEAAEQAAESDPFPPTSVVALDADYNYAWSEEVQALDRLFMGLRSRLVTSAETLQGEVNTAVLRALEVAADRPRQLSVAEAFEKRTDCDGSAAHAPVAAHAAAAGPTSSAVGKLDVESMIETISQLPVISSKDIRLAQSMDDHQRLPSGARAVDVATVLLLQIKEAKGHFSGNSDAPLDNDDKRASAAADSTKKDPRRVKTNK